MGVDHVPPEIGVGGLSPQILSCCKILRTRLLALQCRKMCFFGLYSRTFTVSLAMRPPQNCSQIYAYGYCNAYMTRDPQHFTIFCKLRKTGMRYATATLLPILIDIEHVVQHAYIPPPQSVAVSYHSISLQYTIHQVIR